MMPAARWWQDARTHYLAHEARQAIEARTNVADVLTIRFRAIAHRIECLSHQLNDSELRELREIADQAGRLLGHVEKEVDKGSNGPRQQR